MTNISKNILNEIEQAEHNIRRGFNSKVNTQLDELLDLIAQLQEKGISIHFDNSVPNHYKLTLNNVSYEFTLYKDVKNALLLMLSI